MEANFFWASSARNSPVPGRNKGFIHMKCSPYLSAILSVACLTGAATAAFAEIASKDGDKFTVGATVVGEWNDNRDGTRTDKHDAGKLGVGVRFDYAKQFSWLHVNVAYEPLIRWYLNHDRRETNHEWTHDALVTVKNEPDQRLHFMIQDNFKYIDDNNVYSDLDGNERMSLRYGKGMSYDDNAADNRLSGRLKYLLSEKFFVTGGASWRFLRYENDIASQYSDEDSLKLTAGIWRQMSSTISLGVSGGYGWYDQESPVYDEGMEIATLGLSLNWEIVDRLSADFSWHYQHIMYDADELKDREFPFDFDLNLFYRAGAHSVVNLGYYQRVDQGENYPYASQRKYCVFASLNQQHSDRLSTSLRAEYRLGKYSSKDVQWAISDDEDFEGRAASRANRKGDDKTFVARATLSYWVNEDFRITAYYAWQNVNSEVNRSYVRNTVGARLTYNFY